MPVDTFNQSELKRLAVMRCRVLQLLKRFDPEPVLDSRAVTELSITDADLDFDVTGVRKAFKYLSGHGLASAERQGNQWAAQISSTGIDYLYGVGNVLDGVARP
jgi:hypothetical protein